MRGQVDGALFLFLDADATIFSNPWPHWPAAAPPSQQSAPGAPALDMALLDDEGPTQKGNTSATLNSGCVMIRASRATRCAGAGLSNPCS